MHAPFRPGAAAAKFPARRPGRLAARLGGGAVLIGTLLATAAALAGPAAASGASGATAQQFAHGAARAVFVQTDNLAGNQVVAYHRAADGALTLAGTYNTGGLGGQLSGSVVDHLASQGSLGYDPAFGLLFAVNAGSDTVSVFAASGDRLALRQVIGSGGVFPVSVAVRGSLVYVLNALGGGTLQGFRVAFGRLVPIPGSSRSLGLNPAASPQFTNTPGQAAFSPDGGQLIVTTKANGNDIDVFGVGPGGWLSPSPVVNAEPGTVPFAIAFDPAGHLVIADAGTNALSTFALRPGGTLTALDSVGTGQAATCWVASDGNLEFASNAGSASVSAYAVNWSGQLSLTGQTPTDPGTVDAAVTPSGRFVYVQTGGNGIVDEFAVGSGGSLTEVGSVTVAGAAGGEGIVAP
jgi:6-phosphogluconolactonase (cycloisomerase 2 family)